MGQGNKKKFGRAKGYGPGSSIGSKVGKALGGHLSKQGKLGGGGKKGFNFSFKNFFNKFKPGYASNMGQVTGKLNQLNQPSAWKIKQFADKNIDITKLNKSFKVDIDTNRAIQGIKNETVRNWLTKYTPKAVKDLKINHQMYSPTKIKPTDPRYNPTGTGSMQLDPDTERYLEWMARTNPEGATVSDYEKIYANNLKDGRHTLEQVMRMNPAETKSFYALIDDKDNKNTTQATADLLKSGKATADLLSSNNNSTTNNTMALNQAQVNKLYNEMLGRNATFGDASEYDADYWVGKTADQVKSGISGSSEFLNRKALVDAAGAGGISEADLDKQVMAGGWKTEHHSDYANSGQDLFDFNKGNNWKSGITDAGGNWATEQNAINNVLGATSANNYSTGVGTGSGGGVTDGSTIPADPADPADPAGGWWTEFADKDAFKDFLTGGQQKSDGMGDFMKFMMLMSVMGGGRGGGMMGGGSQYGYGGLNPGGVQAAYNPWESMQTGMKFFKDNFGAGVDGGTTMNATGS